jgi:Flavodoxin
MNGASFCPAWGNPPFACTDMADQSRSFDRRSLLRGTLLLGAAAWVGTQAGGCSTVGRTLASSRAPTPIEAPTASANTARSQALLAYFSRAGENCHNGGTRVLTVGNTQVLAEIIASRVPADVYRIEAADPYPESYSATVQRNVRGEEADARPPIATPLPAVANYETLLPGSPIWNVQEPMIMRTFVEGFDFTGKTISPS